MTDTGWKPVLQRRRMVSARLKGARRHWVLLRKHRREILRLRLGDGMRADVVGLWGAPSHDKLRMTELLRA